MDYVGNSIMCTFLDMKFRWVLVLSDTILLHLFLNICHMAFKVQRCVDINLLSAQQKQSQYYNLPQVSEWAT